MPRDLPAAGSLVSAADINDVALAGLACARSKTFCISTLSTGLPHSAPRILVHFDRAAARVQWRRPRVETANFQTRNGERGTSARSAVLLRRAVLNRRHYSIGR